MRLMPQALPLKVSVNKAPDHSAFKDGSQTLLESPKQCSLSITVAQVRVYQLV